MKSKKIIGLTSVVSLLGVLAACAPDSGIKSDVIEVDFWHTFGQGIVASLTPIIKDFEDLCLEHDGVKVKVNFDYGGDYSVLAAKIKKGFGANSVPTLTVAYPDNVADYLYMEDTPGEKVVNFDDYMDNTEYGFGTESWLGDRSTYTKEDILPSFFEEGQQYIRKGTYSLPYMKSSEVMFYNKEALETAAKLYNPDLEGEQNTKDFIENITWDEFMDFCGFISTSEELKKEMPKLKYPSFYDSDANLFISKMYQNNIGYSSIVEKNGKKVGHIDFESGENRTKAEAMVQKFVEDHEANKFVTRGIDGEYGSNSFKNAETIFSVGSTGGAGYNLPTGKPFEVGVCKVPASNNNPMYVSQGPTFCMLKSPKYKANPEAGEKAQLYAWKLIKFLTNPANNVRVCITGSEGYVPVRQSAYENANFLTYLEEGETLAKVAQLVINGIQDNYIKTPVFTGSAKLRDEAAAIITRCLKKELTISQVFDESINEAKLAIH